MSEAAKEHKAMEKDKRINTKRKPTSVTGGRDQKRSKNSGVWDKMSPSTQQRYLRDAPSPDPWIQKFELDNTLKATVRQLGKMCKEVNKEWTI